MTAALVAGLLAGLGVAMPVGAVGTYLITLTARSSLRVGAGAALGMATADGLYAAVAVLGGAVLVPWLEPVAVPLRGFSALVLVLLAARIIVSGVRAYRPEQRGGGSAPAPPTARRCYAELLGLTLVNPLTVVYFAALVLGTPGDALGTATERIGFVVAALAASAGWNLLLACGAAVLGRLLSGPRGRLFTALAAGGLILFLAGRLLPAPT